MSLPVLDACSVGNFVQSDTVAHHCHWLHRGLEILILSLNIAIMGQAQQDGILLIPRRVLKPTLTEMMPHGICNMPMMASAGALKFQTTTYLLRSKCPPEAGLQGRPSQAWHCTLSQAVPWSTR